MGWYCTDSLMVVVLESERCSWTQLSIRFCGIWVIVGQYEKECSIYVRLDTVGGCDCHFPSLLLIPLFQCSALQGSQGMRQAMSSLHVTSHNSLLVCWRAAQLELENEDPSRWLLLTRCTWATLSLTCSCLYLHQAHAPDRQSEGALGRHCSESQWPN